MTGGLFSALTLCSAWIAIKVEHIHAMPFIFNNILSLKGGLLLFKGEFFSPQRCANGLGVGQGGSHRKRGGLGRRGGGEKPRVRDAAGEGGRMRGWSLIPVPAPVHST